MTFALGINNIADRMPPLAPRAPVLALPSGTAANGIPTGVQPVIVTVGSISSPAASVVVTN